MKGLEPSMQVHSRFPILPTSHIPLQQIFFFFGRRRCFELAKKPVNLDCNVLRAYDVQEWGQKLPPCAPEHKRLQNLTLCWFLIAFNATKGGTISAIWLTNVITSGLLFGLLTNRCWQTVNFMLQKLLQFEKSVNKCCQTFFVHVHLFTRSFTSVLRCWNILARF